jgi:hypothetical protein
VQAAHQAVTRKVSAELGVETWLPDQVLVDKR